MPIASELSRLAKRRRLEIGLTQERLAELVGLSRVTINQLETGKMTNLSLVHAEKIANQLGYGIGLTGVKHAREPGTAIETAARTASVSYSDPIPPQVLRASLITGSVPPNHIPQLRALLDEAPLGVLSAVAAELEAEEDIRARSTWQRMRSLAVAVGCSRGIFT